jgi:hypothetical protein
MHQLHCAFEDHLELVHIDLFLALFAKQCQQCKAKVPSKLAPANNIGNTFKIKKGQHKGDGSI